MIFPVNAEGMIDHILLAPYYLTLKFRHFLYDKGIRKSRTAPIPAISIGNVTAGGTGKTPHTEMLIRMLSQDSIWKGSRISVLSRGYKRKTKGFQQVTADGTATEFGDEPLQIKRKFPQITVAVDKDRIQGCDFLAHPDTLLTSKKARKCKDKNIAPQDLIILDDAFQYRALKPALSIVLMDYARPVFKDHLIPAGRLRDLPSRIYRADIIIVTKCPAYIEDQDKMKCAAELGLQGFDPRTCQAKTPDGKNIGVFFTKINYCDIQTFYPEGEHRYAYSRQAVVITGIANDRPMVMYLSDTYKIVKKISFPDHHRFTPADIRTMEKAAAEYPTAVLVTTEKDSQRFLDCKKISGTLRKRLFRIPITVEFITDHERLCFISALDSALKPCLQMPQGSALRE